MYSDDIQSVILQRMLERVNAKFDKREGSIIWDALAPAAVEFENFYIMLMAVLDEVFADTATRSFLIRRCAERGIEPKPSSAAVVQGEFTPANVDIEIGKRFSHEEYDYKVIEKVSDGVYLLECETNGADVNDITGQLIPIDYVQGLQTAYITEVVIPGENEEDTESLRQRYFNSIKSESFGGNRQDYTDKVLAISGVGGVKIYSGSEWNGGGTVKIVIIDSDHQVPSEELVDKVQNIIDPEVSWDNDKGITVSTNSTGSRLAPIGHIVTVIGAYESKVNINTKLTYASGYSWDKVKGKVEEAIKSYFNSLNRNWQSNDTIRVRISQLESAILNVQGIVDVQHTTLNGKEENLSLDKDSLVTLGEITHA